MVIYTRFLKFYPATLRVERFSGVSICIMETFWVNLWFLSIFTQEVGQDPGKRNCLRCICPKHTYFPPKPSKFPYISSPYRAKLKTLDLYAHMDKFINCESTSATTFYVLLLYKLTRFSNNRDILGELPLVLLPSPDTTEVIPIVTQKRKGRSSICKTIFHLHICMTYLCFIKF